jgi:hypothetical protein
MQLEAFVPSANGDGTICWNGQIGCDHDQIFDLPQKNSAKESTLSKTHIRAAAFTHQRRTKSRKNARPENPVKIILSTVSLVRRAGTIVCYWDGSQLAVSNYRTRVTITAAPVMVLLLSLLNDWLSPAEITRLLPGFESQNVLRAIRKLLRHGVLVQKNSPAAQQDETPFRNYGRRGCHMQPFFTLAPRTCLTNHDQEN